VQIFYGVGYLLSSATGGLLWSQQKAMLANIRRFFIFGVPAGAISF
jgi:hypothetical protein